MCLRLLSSQKVSDLLKEHFWSMQAFNVIFFVAMGMGTASAQVWLHSASNGNVVGHGKQAD